MSAFGKIIHPLPTSENKQGPLPVPGQSPSPAENNRVPGPGTEGFFTPFSIIKSKSSMAPLLPIPPTKSFYPIASFTRGLCIPTLLILPSPPITVSLFPALPQGHSQSSDVWTLHHITFFLYVLLPKEAPFFFDSVTLQTNALLPLSPI